VVTGVQTCALPICLNISNSVLQKRVGCLDPARFCNNKILVLLSLDATYIWFEPNRLPYALIRE